VSLPSLPSLESPQTGGFIPPHGGYENLLSDQKARIVYDATVYFTARFLDKKDRTCDQMVQAARSGKQNIVEGSQISGTSKELEIKLTNVARASLEELRDDYRDLLRARGLAEWTPEHRHTQRLQRRRAGILPAGCRGFQPRVGVRSPHHSASAWLHPTTSTRESDPNRPGQDHRKGHSGTFALPPIKTPLQAAPYRLRFRRA